MSARHRKQTVPVPGYEGYYEVTDQGQVFSLRSGSLTELKGWMHTCGYRYVKLADGPDHTLTDSVHSIVARSFLGPRPEGAHCRHLNGNPLDNRLANLAWGTPKENATDTDAHGRRARGARQGGTKLTDSLVVRIRELYATGRYRQIDLGEMFGIHQMTVSHIVRRRTWTHV